MKVHKEKLRFYVFCSRSCLKYLIFLNMKSTQNNHEFLYNILTPHGWRYLFTLLFIKPWTDDFNHVNVKEWLVFEGLGADAEFVKDHATPVHVGVLVQSDVGLLQWCFLRELFSFSCSYIMYCNIMWLFFSCPPEGALLPPIFIWFIFLIWFDLYSARRRP